jgi:6-phosphogluconolactonase (cycloisomerase 2 family)
MLKSKTVFFMAVIPVITLLFIFGCTLLPQDDPKEHDWYISLNIKNPTEAKSITVQEYDVVGLDIEVFDPTCQLIDTITWDVEEGSKSYPIPVNQEGQYKIDVTHIGKKNGSFVEAEESATFNIQAMVITVIEITPGRIGIINVDNGDGSGTSPATDTSTRLYTLDIPLNLQGPNTINGYTINGSGGLTVLSGFPFSTGGEGRQMSSNSRLLSSPLGNFLFASNNASGGITVYSIDSGGNLSKVPGSPFVTAGPPSYLAIHPNGKFLYATSGRTAVEGFVVNSSTGVLTPISGSPFYVGTEPRDIAVHPKGNFLYVGHMFDSDRGISVHSIDPVSGALTFSSSLDLSCRGRRPGNRITIDSQGTRLFCTDLDRGIFIADIDTDNGSLTLTQNAPFNLESLYVGAMTTTSGGEFLYVAVWAKYPANLLHGFRVEPSGDLTPVKGSPYSNVGGTTIYIRTDGADRHLFASSRSDNNIRVYDIESDGSLSEVSGSPFANTNPSGIVGPILPW